MKMSLQWGSLVREVLVIFSAVYMRNRPQTLADLVILMGDLFNERIFLMRDIFYDSNLSKTTFFILKYFMIYKQHTCQWISGQKWKKECFLNLRKGELWAKECPFIALGAVKRVWVIS